MSLLGKAALAMWWDIAPDVRADFEHWHAHEHFPERLGLPGFRRGTRWTAANGGDGMFVMYELESHLTLSSPDYLARLNAPTAWSTRLMPHHRNMVRSQCHVLESRGGGIARHALTVRLAPAPGRDAELRSRLAGLVRTLPERPGLTGAHLLQHQTPAIATTTEQMIRRGADQAADWVFVVCGYDLDALAQVASSELSAHRLEGEGAAHEPISGLYGIAYSATPADVT